MQTSRTRGNRSTSVGPGGARPGRGGPGRWGAAAAVFAGALSGTIILAQGSPSPPDGFGVGPWYLAPYLVATYENDDNVLRRSADRGVVEDTVTRLTAGLGARLPFGASLLELTYAGTRLGYEKTSRLDDELNEDIGARLDLQFSSGDRLELGELRASGVADIQRVDDGGELVFEGEPFAFRDRYVELSRRIPRRRGYGLRLSESDFRYDTDRSVRFFDFDGYAFELEFRQPVAASGWLELSYEGRREDQFTRPFRKQSSDRVLVGFRSQLGPSQQVRFELGRDDFRLRGASPSTTREPVLTAEWGRSTQQSGTNVSFRRRVRSSRANTGYVSQDLSVQFQSRWLRYSRVGFQARVAQNRYADPVDWRGQCPTLVDADCPGSFLREDDLNSATVFVIIAPREKFGVQFAATKLRRQSNFEVAAFDSTVLSVGIVMGWYEQ